MIEQYESLEQETGSLLVTDRSLSHELEFVLGARDSVPETSENVMASLANKSN